MSSPKDINKILQNMISYTITRVADQTLQFDPPAGSLELATALSLHFPLEPTLEAKATAALLKYVENEKRCLKDNSRNADLDQPVERGIGPALLPPITPTLSDNVYTDGKPRQSDIVQATNLTGSPQLMSLQLYKPSHQRVTRPKSASICKPPVMVWDLKSGKVTNRAKRRCYEPEEAREVAQNRKTDSVCDHHRRKKRKCDPKLCADNKLYQAIKMQKIPQDSYLQTSGIRQESFDSEATYTRSSRNFEEPSENERVSISNRDIQTGSLGLDIYGADTPDLEVSSNFKELGKVMRKNGNNPFDMFGPGVIDAICVLLTGIEDQGQTVHFVSNIKIPPMIVGPTFRGEMPTVSPNNATNATPSETDASGPSKDDSDQGREDDANQDGSNNDSGGSEPPDSSSDFDFDVDFDYDSYYDPGQWDNFGSSNEYTRDRQMSLHFRAHIVQQLAYYYWAWRVSFHANVISQVQPIRQGNIEGVENTYGNRWHLGRHYAQRRQPPRHVSSRGFISSPVVRLAICSNS